MVQQGIFNSVSTRQQSQSSETGVEDIINIEAASRLDEPLLTHGWIDNRVENGLSHFSEFRRMCRKADSFILGNFPVSVPKDGTLIRLGTGHSIIKTLVAHVTPSFPDITVPAPGPRGQARAEKLERFLLASNQSIERHTPVDRQIAQMAGLYGVSFEKPQFAGQMWPEFPEIPEDEEDGGEYREAVKEIMSRRGINFPITSEAINPQEVIWDDTNVLEPRWLIHQYETDAAWVDAHFGVDFGGDYSGRKTGVVQFEEIWTHAQVAYRTDEQWALSPRKHGYRNLPWIKYCPQTGVKTIGSKPEDLYRGILHSNFGMLQAQSKLASHYVDIVEKSTHPTADWSGPPGITTDAMNRYDHRPGAENFLPQNVTRGISAIPRPPQEIILAKEMLDEAIEENSAPAVSRGQRPTGAASGYHSAVLAGIAALNFGAVKEAMERGKERRNTIILNIVEHVIRDRITVYGRTEAGPIDESIGPNDIRGHTISIVRLSSVSPEEAERKRRLARDEWQAGFIDHSTALRNAGQENPLQVLGNRQAEDFLNSEAVQTALQQFAAQRVPVLAQIFEAQGSSANEAEDMASAILGNAGQFSTTDQPLATTGTEPGRTRTNTEGTIPGSFKDAQVTAAQISGPRSGPVATTRGALGPGGRA